MAVAGLAGAGTAAASAPTVAGPLTFSPPTKIDRNSPFSDPPDLLGVSCPTATLCVAYDASGDVVTSTDPTGGPSAWSAANVDGSIPLSGVSCPTTSLCVAVDGLGNVLTSTDPTGGASSWTTTHLGGGGFSDVDCPTSSLCVATSGSGGNDELVTSTDPTGGASTWHTITLAGGSGVTRRGLPDLLAVRRSRRRRERADLDRPHR